MTTSYTSTDSDSWSFTVTDARNMAAKVATDLKRMQRLYGLPSDTDIAAYETEAIELLRYGYLGTVTYGYRRDDNWIEPTLRYSARDLINEAANDDDPGRVRPGADVVGAVFHSYLIRSQAWHALTQSQRDTFENQLPFQRRGAPEPGINGYLRNDLTYSSGSRALARASVRSY